jgi:hypothetical protein
MRCATTHTRRRHTVKDILDAITASQTTAADFAAPPHPES